MPTPAQLSRFMSASSKQNDGGLASSDLSFAAAMPLYQLKPFETPKAVNLAGVVHIVNDTGFVQD